MFRIDNSSAATTLPTPKPVGTPGFFSVGTIAGQRATIVEADWLNMIQEEVLNVVLRAGIAPSKLDDTQLITAILWLIQNNTRLRLTGNLDLYCSPNGSDTNNGLTPESPWRTPQAAWNFIMSHLDMGANTVTVNLADGSYPGLECSGTPVGQRGFQVVFRGNVVNPPAVVLSGLNTSAVIASVGAIVSVQSLRVESSGTGFGGVGLLSLPGGLLAFSNIDFSTCSMTHMQAEGGQLSGQGQAYTVSGNARNHIVSNYAGSLNISNATVTLYSSPNFTDAFVNLSTLGVAALQEVTFNGPAVGRRFGVGTNAVLQLGYGASDPNSYLPGTETGTTADGGLVTF